MSLFSTSYRVYYEDTDAGGVMYYARYLAFAERARTDWLLQAGLSNTAIRDNFGVLLVVASVQADYHKPAKLEDLLTVDTVVDEIKRVSFVMTHNIKCEQQPIATIKVTLVSIKQDSGKPTALPADLLPVLTR